MLGRRYLVGGNWKCNGTKDSVLKLVQTLNKMTFNLKKVDVVVAPISLHIPLVQQHLDKSIQVSAQNISPYKSGAYTGEVSVDQLRDIGIKWAIVGHSERRHIFHQNDQVKFVDFISPLSYIDGSCQSEISSVGWYQCHCMYWIKIRGEIRLQDDGSNRQIDESYKWQADSIRQKIIDQISSWKNIVVAYEPVWAIGTGKVATPEQAQQVHAFTRQWLLKNSSKEASQETRIIYGGSVNAKNSDNLIGKEDVDGFLVGGAALKPEFGDIVASCNK